MRVCACGCGESLEGRRPQARYFEGGCRAKASRALREAHIAKTLSGPTPAVAVPVPAVAARDSTGTAFTATAAAEVAIAAADTHKRPHRDRDPLPARANRTETAHNPSDGMSVYIGGPCSDELRCKYRHRFTTGPWTCAWNHPRYSSR